ncbi:hypothetical protein Phi40:1_gp049 [Cellulophaga phage phi40:1]|jgi:hypothetical protein|uniref:Uncharacterized protein n=1 Tax=Cellulophaga phage phi38:1 TaxID=1327977 RepID=R9ZXV5_9CAUD|nr:hypothetical protein Phi38:1_gp049 [Cellulophaga phage phi38:1]AGO47914.1 hypothetical protein Phi40:1_gp049 [Cellulophaga phage phi40:1]AGO48079.1 hypothetical protein Phi38:1_gp049 [Cellulophaga phage phi38:1]
MGVLGETRVDNSSKNHMTKQNTFNILHTNKNQLIIKAVEHRTKINYGKQGTIRKVHRFNLSIF